MKFQKPDKKIIDAKLKEQRELLVKERDGLVGTEDSS